MSRNKANRLFSFLALFSIVFNNILTPLSVYAEDVQENPQQQEDVLVEPTPSTEETQDQVEITPTETIIPMPTVEESIITSPEATPEVSGETNEAAQPQAPPATDTPTPTPSVEIVAPQGDETLKAEIIENVDASSVSVTSFKSDGTFETDKFDYAPTDVVIFTGKGFESNMEYELKITGTGSFVFSDKITTNENGEILYSYQLDGEYRPSYKAEILSGVEIVASVEFTDSVSGYLSPNQTISSSSVGNPNEAWSSNDIRAIFDSGAGPDEAIYGFGDFGIPSDATITGIEVRLEGNTSDKRNLYVALWKESHGSDHFTSNASIGLSKNSDTVVVAGGQTSVWGESNNWEVSDFDDSRFKIRIQAVPSYGAGEARLDHVQVRVYYNVGYVPTRICHATSSASNPYESNTPATVGVLMGHVGGAHSGDIIPPITDWLPAGQNWDPEHIAIYNYGKNGCEVPPTTGSITITKDVVPNDSSVWDFTVAGMGVNLSKNDLGDGQSYKFDNLVPGSYNISEIPDSKYVTTVKCGESGPFTKYEFLGTVVAGQDLACTFTNTLKPVTFTINKYIDQDGDLKNTTGDRFDGVGWTFQIYKEGAAPQLMATGTTDSTGNISMPPFYPESGKTYRVVEQSQSGYSFVSAKCGIAATPRGQIGTDSVDSISVNPGENIVCDFYNKPATGVLKITKDSRPNDTQDFLFTIRDSQGNIVGNAELDDWSGSSRPDNKSFTLNAGTYYITETVEGGSPDWKLTDAVCTTDTGSLGNYGFTPDGRFSAEVLPGQNMNCTFINTKYGGVYGEKFNDKNGNNIDDSGEEDLRGWRIYVDLNENGKYDSGEPTDVTDSGGDYSIGGLLPGEYSICEVQQSGWYSSLPNNALCQKTTIHSDGGDWDEVSFGNHGIVTIKAYKIVCPMEASLPNWGYGPYGSIDGGTADWFLSHHTGCYYQDNWEFQWGYGGRGGVSSVPGDHIGYAPKTGDDYDEWKNFNTATNNHYGSQYSAKAYISDLKGSSSLWVREVLPSDEWLPFSDDTTWPRDNDVSAEMYCSGDILNYDNYDEINNPLYGESYYCIAFNTLNKGKITGVKWEDVDGDMHYERGENTIAGWNITATDSQGHSYSASTNASGEYEFDNLMPGEYTVCEENQRGYIQTYPSEQSCHTVTVIGGRTESGNNFGNMPVDLNLAIEKTNILNTSNATVDYTIKVTNTGNMNFNSYEIHDALPGGFTYLAGSSYLNDNPIDDPVFNSGEAMWSIEEGLEIGETAILTYRATFDSGLPAGFYTNFAYAVGVFYYPWDNPEPSVFERAMIVDDSDDYTHEEPIIIRVSDTATTEIVDSQVELLSSVSYGGKLTGQVLGASTDVLPATGSETWVIMLATAFVVVGFVTKGAAIMIERKRKNE